MDEKECKSTVKINKHAPVPKARNASEEDIDGNVSYIPPGDYRVEEMSGSIPDDDVQTMPQEEFQDEHHHDSDTELVPREQSGDDHMVETEPRYGNDTNPNEASGELEQVPVHEESFHEDEFDKSQDEHVEDHPGGPPEEFFHEDEFDKSQDKHVEDHPGGPPEEFFHEDENITNEGTGRLLYGEKVLPAERPARRQGEQHENSRGRNKPKDWTVEEFFKMLENPPARCNGILQIGGEYILTQDENLIKDGQKEVCDKAPRTNFKRIRPNNCTVYSFGVGYDWSFEKDATRTLKCKVHAFDPESKYLYHGKDHRPMRNLWFYARGIGAKNGYVKGETGAKWRLQTLDSIMQHLGHESIDLIKMDIQGWEWPALEQLIASGALRKVNHLCIEVHFSLRKIERQVRMIQALHDAGFQLFSAHPNPTVGHTFIKQLNRKDKLQYELAWYRI
ncbi:Methyltransferase-like protein 24 [Nymphon striatum]|nr:Methyltransferase-like protein 24 [Nymphon striatum]